METKQIIFSTAYARLAEKFAHDQARLLALFLVAQAQHETGNFQSDAFRRNNNIGGYKPYPGSPYQRNPPPAGANVKYAYFDSVENSTLEIADWLRRRANSFATVKSVAEYALALKKEKYYEDTVANYSKGLGFYFSGLVADGLDSFGAVVTGDFDKKHIKPIAILVGGVLLLFWIVRKII